MPAVEHTPEPEKAASRVILRRKIILAINLALGLFLWFGYCTDYSWAGIIPDYCYPVLVASVALVSWLLRDRHVDERSRHRYKLFLMPSLVGGGAALFSALIAVLPPFTLGFVFALEEVKAEKLIQTVPSPNGAKIADVYFRPVGAYTGGNGRIFVRVRYRRLPFIERDLYYFGRSYANEDTHDYLCWKNNSRILIIGEPNSKPQEIKVGIVQFATSMNIVFPFGLMITLLVIRKKMRD
ncbi:MAG: hypothetical protein K6U74_15735 [Firmicutes bacterium]|nr:hypothetical protein [Bacillota bacterium]